MRRLAKATAFDQCALGSADRPYLPPPQLGMYQAKKDKRSEPRWTLPSDKNPVRPAQRLEQPLVVGNRFGGAENEDTL
jgi:hypothetical protein